MNEGKYIGEKLNDCEGKMEEKRFIYHNKIKTKHKRALRLNKLSGA